MFVVPSCAIFASIIARSSGVTRTLSWMSRFRFAMSQLKILLLCGRLLLLRRSLL